MSMSLVDCLDWFRELVPDRRERRRVFTQMYVSIVMPAMNSGTVCCAPDNAGAGDGQSCCWWGRCVKWRGRHRRHHRRRHRCRHDVAWHPRNVEKNWQRAGCSEPQLVAEIRGRPWAGRTPVWMMRAHRAACPRQYLSQPGAGGAGSLMDSQAQTVFWRRPAVEAVCSGVLCLRRRSCHLPPTRVSHWHSDSGDRHCS